MSLEQLSRVLKSSASHPARSVPTGSVSKIDQLYQESIEQFTPLNVLHFKQKRSHGPNPKVSQVIQRLDQKHKGQFSKYLKEVAPLMTYIRDMPLQFAFQYDFENSAHAFVEKNPALLNDSQYEENFKEAFWGVLEALNQLNAYHGSVCPQPGALPLKFDVGVMRNRGSKLLEDAKNRFLLLQRVLESAKCQSPAKEKLFKSKLEPLYKLLEVVDYLRDLHMSDEDYSLSIQHLDAIDGSLTPDYAALPATILRLIEQLVYQTSETHLKRGLGKINVPFNATALKNFIAQYRTSLIHVKGELEPFVKKPPAKPIEMFRCVYGFRVDFLEAMEATHLALAAPMKCAPEEGTTIEVAPREISSLEFNSISILLSDSLVATYKHSTIKNMLELLMQHHFLKNKTFDTKVVDNMIEGIGDLHPLMSVLRDRKVFTSCFEEVNLDQPEWKTFKEESYDVLYVKTASHIDRILSKWDSGFLNTLVGRLQKLNEVKAQNIDAHFMYELTIDLMQHVVRDLVAAAAEFERRYETLLTDFEVLKKTESLDAQKLKGLFNEIHFWFTCALKGPAESMEEQLENLLELDFLKEPEPKTPTKPAIKAAPKASPKPPEKKKELPAVLDTPTLTTIVAAPVLKPLPTIKKQTKSPEEEELRSLKSEGARKIRNFLDIVKKYGWYLERKKGSHFQYQHPEYSGTVTIPDHDTLKLGTAMAILKEIQAKEKLV